MTTLTPAQARTTLQINPVWWIAAFVASGLLWWGLFSLLRWIF